MTLMHDIKPRTPREKDSWFARAMRDPQRTALKLFTAQSAILWFILPILVLGAVTVNISIQTNPNIQNGLVGYWPFDGANTSGVTPDSRAYGI